MDNQQVNSRKLEKLDDEYIRSNYVLTDPNSIRKIANSLNVKESDVRKRVARLKLDPSKNISYSDVTMKVKYPTIENAYLLGVYLSDGWIEKDCFAISSKDIDYIEEILRCLDNVLVEGFNRNIRTHTAEHLNDGRKSSAKYSSDNYRIRIRSSDLCAWFISNTKSKQTISDIFLNSSEEILKSLLAGAMDGDGFCSLDKRRNIYERCLSGYKIGLCGNRYIYGSVEKYPTIFNRLGIRYREEPQKTKSAGFVSYILNASDFADKKCYFKIERKQSKIEQLRKVRENLNEHHGISVKG